ncbi:MAG: imidazolonepropionase [Ignavibacteriales bacterium CG07_land_8_20_14_0_80_59_12]|nr:MAG: imidazolonepropionase [Ignavibacteriales bacterium CG07_land_8_20_14_0_80_59_12]
MAVRLLIRNASQLVTVSAHGARTKRGAEMRDLGIIEDGALLIDEGKIAWVGRSADAPSFDRSSPDVEVFDAEGRVVMPGFVDPHTHLIFAGSREDEFALRCEGLTYQQIAERGGGILNTVRATRGTDRKKLRSLASHRLDRLLRYGTTTAEIKSGYGLTEEDELKMLQAAHDLSAEHLVTVVSTFLGAHALPPEYADDRTGYIELITSQMIPYIARKGLARFVDVFCDSGYFTREETVRIFESATSNGLGLKLHADELSATGAVEDAARFGAASVDHLEYISKEEIGLLAKSETAAVLLPGVSFFLAQRYAPARELIESGAVVAIASDYNPGSCMSFSMPLMITIACTQMKMTPEEAITAATLNAAAAIGLSGERGSLEVGKWADIIILESSSYRSLPYEFGGNPIAHVVKNGVLLEF